MIQKAQDIVSVIIEDIKDRSGIGNEWDQIDEETQDEIKQTWVQKIINILNGANYDFVPRQLVERMKKEGLI
jgi:hypothetical protein